MLHLKRYQRNSVLKIIKIPLYTQVSQKKTLRMITDEQVTFMSRGQLTNK